MQSIVSACFLQSFCETMVTLPALALCGPQGLPSTSTAATRRLVAEALKWNCLKTWWITVNHCESIQIRQLLDLIWSNSPTWSNMILHTKSETWTSPTFHQVEVSKWGDHFSMRRSAGKPPERRRTPHAEAATTSRWWVIHLGVSKKSENRLKIGSKWLKKGFKSIRVPPLEGNFGGEWWFWMILTMVGYQTLCLERYHINISKKQIPMLVSTQRISTNASSSKWKPQDSMTVKFNPFQVSKLRDTQKGYPTDTSTSRV